MERRERHTEADEAWREKSDTNFSVIGVMVILAAIGLPLLLL